MFAKCTYSLYVCTMRWNCWTRIQTERDWSTRFQRTAMQFHFCTRPFGRLANRVWGKWAENENEVKWKKSQSAVCDVELQAPKENEMIQDSFSWAITTRERVTLHIARALTSNQVLRINVKHMHNFYATQPIVVRVRRCLHFAWLDFISYCLRFAGSSLFSLFFHFSRFACLLFSSKFIILILCCILSGLFSIHCVERTTSTTIPSYMCGVRSFFLLVIFRTSFFASHSVPTILIRCCLDVSLQSTHYFIQCIYKTYTKCIREQWFGSLDCAHQPFQSPQNMKQTCLFANDVPEWNCESPTYWNRDEM